MQVSTKPRLKEEKSLHTLSAPKYTSAELGFCYHHIGYLKGKDLEIGLCLSFLLLFLPFSPPPEPGLIFLLKGPIK